MTTEENRETSSATLRLAPDALRNRCDPAQFDFDSTAELAPLEESLGQERAVEALEFGRAIAARGYNVFVLGSTGVGKHGLVADFLGETPAPLGELADWCYVNNFEVPHRPRLLKMPAGRGRALAADMRRLVEDLVASVAATFQGDAYQSRMQELREELHEREQQAFRDLGERAAAEGIALLQTPAGYTLAPMKDKKIVAPAEFEALPEAERQHTLENIERFREQLKGVLRQLPLWAKEGRDRARDIDHEFSRNAIDPLFADLAANYLDLPEVLGYLDAVRENVIENVAAIRADGDGEENQGATRGADDFPQYSVNVMVDNDQGTRAPLVHEDNPTLVNLIGRVEHVAQYGALLTNFTLIKAGALHRANGGYLVLDAARMLTSAQSWEALKRVLRAREIRIESLERLYGFAGTMQLEPEPVPLEVKVILTGDRYLYYLLKHYDPEFDTLFKVAADLAEDMPRDDANTRRYARLLKTLQSRAELRPLAPAAVARVVEHGARQVGDGRKLSLHLGSVSDLLAESDYFAGRDHAEVVGADHVQAAIDAAQRRMDQIRERAHEHILRDIQLVDTAGSRVGQVNGLSVFEIGDYAFGEPVRITATARLGSGGVTDIEREVELGGRIHSKAVMILSAYLAHRYARNCPLPLSASLAFEQSYGGVEGDSASVAELVALLSALASVPVRQEIAVTGSINQHGEVQAIGGVNEKIEGFFEICRSRGLSGTQGVIVPRGNLDHLMLHQDVLEAVAEERFHVYAVSKVDQAIEILTGLAMGVEDEEKGYPEGTFNHRVASRIDELIALGKHFSGPEGGDDFES